MERSMEELLRYAKESTGDYISLFEKSMGFGSENSILISKMEDWKYFKEDADRADKASSLLAASMAHLFKLKYRTYDTDDQKWMDEVFGFRSDAARALKYQAKSEIKAAVSDVRRHFQEVYEKAIKKYHYFQKSNKYLPDIDDILPDQCLWSFDEYMDKGIADLLKDLPDIN